MSLKPPLPANASFASAAGGPARVVNAGNLGSSYTFALENDPNVWLVGTVNADVTITVTGLTPGAMGLMLLTQDGTGGWDVTVTDGDTSTVVWNEGSADTTLTATAACVDDETVFAATMGAQGLQGVPGTAQGSTALNLWDSQSTPASVTDWGAIINTYVAAGIRDFYFDEHEFPFTTQIDLEETEGVTFAGTGGAIYPVVRSVNNVAFSRLLWKGGASSGAAIKLGDTTDGPTIRDMGIYYDHASYDGDLIQFGTGAFGSVGRAQILRCHIGARDNAQRTARSLLRMESAVSCTVESCCLNGAQSVLRGFEIAVSDISDNNRIIGNGFFNSTNAHIMNPGRYWTIDGNTFDYGAFGDFDTPKGISSDIAQAGAVAARFSYTNNQNWDPGDSATQVAIHAPSNAEYHVYAHSNLFNVKRAYVLEGGGKLYSRHDHWQLTFVGGDPSPIDLGTTAISSADIRDYQIQINSGGPDFVANADQHKFLTIGGQFHTHWGHRRSARLSTNLTTATASGASNVASTGIFGNDEAGIVEINISGGGASSTGRLVDVTFTTPHTDLPGGWDNTVVMLTPTEIQGYTTNIGTAAAANAYASIIDGAGFSIGVQTALAASAKAHYAYRVIRT